MPTDQKQTPPTPVRLPADLRVWLKHQAVDNHRSLNQEIAHRLTKSREDQESKKPDA